MDNKLYIGSNLVEDGYVYISSKPVINKDMTRVKLKPTPPSAPIRRKNALDILQEVKLKPIPILKKQTYAPRHPVLAELVYKFNNFVTDTIDVAECHSVMTS